jgi:hypothetical protein
VPGGGVGDGLVGEKVGAGAPGCVVFRRGDEELAGGVEFVGVPSGRQHALTEDEVDVFVLTDPEADPHVHLHDPDLAVDGEHDPGAVRGNSGELAAWPLATCVSCRSPVPSGLIVKICGRWLKAVSNTILPFAPGNAA